MDSIISFKQKNTLAEYMIFFDAKNHLPMLDKDLYDSWKSRIELYMQNREHERMILESVEHGPLIWPTVKENGVIRTKKYAELSAAEKIQADCNIKATNIILQGLPVDIYSLVNHHRVAKDLWKRVQLLMQGTSLTKQERECNMYDAFDKFTHIKGESLHTLPPEWSKFVTDAKLVKELHTSNYDQLHAYLEQHELHANEGFAVSVFSSGYDPIDCLNKAIAFLADATSLRFPSTNNQLRTSANTRNQATIQDDRVTVQQVQGRQRKNYFGTTYKGNATSSRGNTTSGQARVVKCYNCQGDGGVSGVSLSVVSSFDDKNGETVGNGGIWPDDGSSDGSDSGFLRRLRSEPVTEILTPSPISSDVVAWSGDAVFMNCNETNGRVPLHLMSSVGDSSGTHHCGEKDPYVEKVFVDVCAPNGKSRTVCIPQIMGGLVRHFVEIIFGVLSHSFWPLAKFSMASHASSPLNSLRFLSAAKSRSIRGFLRWLRSDVLTEILTPSPRSSDVVVWSGDSVSMNSTVVVGVDEAVAAMVWMMMMAYGCDEVMGMMTRLTEMMEMTSGVDDDDDVRLVRVEVLCDGVGGRPKMGGWNLNPNTTFSQEQPKSKHFLMTYAVKVVVVRWRRLLAAFFAVMLTMYGVRWWRRLVLVRACVGGVWRAMTTKYEIEKFNGNNFSLWILKMKAIFRKDKCLAAIGERPVEVTNDSKWDEMDGNAIENMHLALADGVLSSIEEKNTANDIWDHLTRLYEARSLHNKFFLKRKLYALRMTESTSVTEHVNNLNNVEALVVTKGKSMESRSSGSHNHGKSKTRKKKNNFRCFKCGKQGHFKKDYRGSNTSNPQGNVASTSDDGNSLCCEAAVANEGKKRFADVWLFDTGANFHMTARREWFHQYKPISEGGFVYSCNDHELKITGIRSIMVKMHDDDVGCKVEIQNKIMKIIKGTLVLMIGEKVAANLYQLKGEIMEEAEASVASHSLRHKVAISWHQKLGHISEQGMKILVNRKLLPGLTKVSLPFYEYSVQSLGGAKYFVSFIDDYSRRCWVYPIKKKSDVFEVFKVYKAWVELDSGTKIKCLRTDNESEYTGDEFDLFCRKEGIKRQFTIAYTPQQNGVAERMNRTLLERARAMLATASLGKSFEAEAVNTACYVIKRSPSTTVELKTPMEMWTGKPVKKCLFLGYADGFKGYRLWDPTAHKVVISRDVVFIEDKIQENEEGVSTTRETTTIQMEKEFQSNDSSEAVPQHEVNEMTESQAPTTHTLYRERRRLGWQADYVMESNISYYLLTEDGESSTLQEALNNPDASF
uniref:Gag-Pol polyprotein n=1 Tax=Tanacetum cinerariifolium TaxID=118510 RepID=A0A6L2LKA0_TANCI|nr:Gag-Pol polyprotein [Tanacetum cinerariifolium]